MDEKFKDDELLLRAVWPPTKRPDFWKSNGKISSAALKVKNGLSVNRTAHLTLEEAVNFTASRLNGSIVSISVKSCSFVNAFVKYAPSNDNEFHSEIYGNKEQDALSDEQAFVLAKEAKLVYRPNAEYII